MIQKRLEHHPSELLRSGHKLRGAVILYGSSGHWGTNQQSKTNKPVVYLGVAPTETVSLDSREDLLAFRARLTSNRLPDHPSESVPSGWIGYFTYEAGAALSGFDCQGLPLGRFGYYPLIIKLNLEQGTSIAYWEDDLDQATVRRILSVISTTNNTDTSTANDEIQWRAGWEQTEYQQAFARVKHYLEAGDCYQINLTMPFYTPADLTQRSPVGLFNAFQPSFGVYSNLGGSVLFSVSPERFISVINGRIETRPIKGTAARGTNSEEDLANIEWLKNSQKNQAENLMIVDLLRNDLSINAKPFSVSVAKLFAIETHANVHHMVSTITAELPESRSPADVILDALPGGSITGAPKKRAMEIIRELEVGPRGAYCGVFGYFNRAGDCDFNILIRTIEATQEGAQCWAGGGIVYDSDVDEEWLELQTKVRQLLDWTFA